MEKFLSFVIRLALLVLGLVFGYYIGLNNGREKARFEQKSRSIAEIKSELKAREDNSILSYLNGTSKIETKDEGSFFKPKYVQYLTGTLTNSAILSTAKDVKLKIIYFSKTNTEIGSQDITIYEYIKPNQSLNFKERVSVPTQVAEFKFQIVEANPNL